MTNLLPIVLLLLMFNFLVAMIAVLRRGRPRGWLLVLLLSSTTGAALAAVYGLLTAEDAGRVADTSLIFTSLAAISAVVAVVAHRKYRTTSTDSAGADAGVT